MTSRFICALTLWPDAEQLKVLNETYNRTAFPSTEERNELAKKLGMSARSVQIW